MKCEKATSLVEKLADGEATVEEKARAEAHIETCETCRTHYAFLTSVAETRRSRPLSEPPEAYWSSMTRNILARIADEEMSRSQEHIPSRAPALLSGTSMRFAGLAAGVLLAVAVVWNVTHTESDIPASSDVSEQAVAPPSVAPPVPEEEVAPVEPNSPPGSASEPRRRVDAETRQQLAERVTTAGENEPKPQMAAKSMEDARGPEAESVEGFSRAEAREAPRASAAAPSRVVVQDRAASETPTLGSASRLERALPEAEPGATCERFREALQRVGEGGEATDFSFRLARCELARYESEPSEQTRTRAIADAEAFLNLEPEGKRAEEIRRALSRVPREEGH